MERASSVSKESIISGGLLDSVSQICVRNTKRFCKLGQPERARFQRIGRRVGELIAVGMGVVLSLSGCCVQCTKEPKATMESKVTVVPLTEVSV